MPMPVSATEITTSSGVRRADSVLQFVVYLTLMQSMTIPVVAWLRRGPLVLRFARDHWRIGLFGGFNYCVAYGLVLFAMTLDKTTGQFSPTTRYRDYAISRDLIHWESQSITRADSDTGQRYQRHEALGTSIMLFARLRSDDRAFWFLGPANYVKHESELPMAVTWRLDHSLPGDLFAQFAAAVA